MKALHAMMLAAALGIAPAFLRADLTPAGPNAAPVALPASASAPLQPFNSSTLQASPATSAPAPSSSPLSLSAPSANDPQVGQPESTVYDLLGKPMGRILLPDKAVILMYDRGDVTIRNGLVAAVKLLDPAAYAAKNAKEAALLAEREKENARLLALRKSFLSDPGYLSLSTPDRLTAMDRFDEEYPGSGIRDDYDSLMAVYEAELAAESQLADLEKRLTEAEQQTADAEQQAADAQQQAAAAQQQATAQQNNQPGGYINTNVVGSNGYNVYYVGNPYSVTRWGSLHGGFYRAVPPIGGNTTLAAQNSGNEN